MQFRFWGLMTEDIYASNIWWRGLKMTFWSLLHCYKSIIKNRLLTVFNITSLCSFPLISASPSHSNHLYAFPTDSLPCPIVPRADTTDRGNPSSIMYAASNLRLAGPFPPHGVSIAFWNLTVPLGGNWLDFNLQFSRSFFLQFAPSSVHMHSNVIMTDL